MPGAGGRAREAAVCSQARAGRWQLCSRMASQPPHPSWYLRYRVMGRKTYSSIYPDRRGKRAPREPPPVAPADGALGRRRLPLGTLVKAIVVLKRLAADIRRGHILPCLNPLTTEQKAPEKRAVAMPEKTVWGDQEPLSKVSAALGRAPGQPRPEPTRWAEGWAEAEEPRQARLPPGVAGETGLSWEAVAGGDSVLKRLP